jgi:predicted RND superfamily exporter protein
MIPALLITIGFPEDIHLIAAYEERLSQGQDRRTALHATMSDLFLPISVTTATTILGFGSLVTTDVGMLIQYGYAAAIGLAANFVVTMALAPALLAMWPVSPRRHAAIPDAHPTSRSLNESLVRFGEFLIRRRRAVVLAALTLSCLSLLGWTGLRVNTDFLSYFPENTSIRRDVDDFHQSLGGGVLFYVVVDAGRSHGATEPAVLRAIVQLQEFLMSTGKVDKTVSVADFLRTMHREMNGGDPAFEVIPPTRDLVAQYLLLLEGTDLSRYLDFDASSVNIVVNHHVRSSWELASLLAQLDAFRATLDPALTVGVTGENILIHNAADVMVINEITSFIYAFAFIGLIHAWLFKSFTAAVLSLIPNVIPIFAGFGLMGLMGVPLNTGTAMVATVAIGIAVDDTVHFVDAFRRHLAATGDAATAVLLTLQSQGRPIIYVSLTLAAGFLVLTASNFVPTRNFGMFSAIVMLVAMLTELVLTPILLYSIPRARAVVRSDGLQPDPVGRPPIRL